MSRCSMQANYVLPERILPSVREGPEADEQNLLSSCSSDKPHSTRTSRTARARASCSPTWPRSARTRRGSFRHGVSSWTRTATADRARIGQPIWRGRTRDELVECERHEALLNLAFREDSSFRLLCPYDTTTLDEAVIEEAGRSDPVWSSRPKRTSASYRGLPAFAAPSTSCFCPCDVMKLGASDVETLGGCLRRPSCRGGRGGPGEMMARRSVLARQRRVATRSVSVTGAGWKRFASGWHVGPAARSRRGGLDRRRRLPAGKSWSATSSGEEGLWTAELTRDLVEVATFATCSVLCGSTCAGPLREEAGAPRCSPGAPAPAASSASSASSFRSCSGSMSSRLDEVASESDCSNAAAGSAWSARRRSARSRSARCRSVRRERRARAPAPRWAEPRGAPSCCLSQRHRLAGLPDLDERRRASSTRTGTPRLVASTPRLEARVCGGPLSTSVLRRVRTGRGRCARATGRASSAMKRVRPVSIQRVERHAGRPSVKRSLVLERAACRTGSTSSARFRGSGRLVPVCCERVRLSSPSARPNGAESTRCLRGACEANRLDQVGAVVAPRRSGARSAGALFVPWVR